MIKMFSENEHCMTRILSKDTNINSNARKQIIENNRSKAKKKNNGGIKEYVKITNQPLF